MAGRQGEVEPSTRAPFISFFLPFSKLKNQKLVYFRQQHIANNNDRLENTVQTLE